MFIPAVCKRQARLAVAVAVARKTTCNLTDRGLSLGHWQRGGGGGRDGEAVNRIWGHDHKCKHNKKILVRPATGLLFFITSACNHVGHFRKTFYLRGLLEAASFQRLIK